MSAKAKTEKKKKKGRKKQNKKKQERKVFVQNKFWYASFSPEKRRRAAALDVLALRASCEGRPGARPIARAVSSRSLASRRNIQQPQVSNESIVLIICSASLLCIVLSSRGRGTKNYLTTRKPPPKIAKRERRGFFLFFLNPSPTPDN